MHSKVGMIGYVMKDRHKPHFITANKGVTGQAGRMRAYSLRLPKVCA